MTKNLARKLNSILLVDDDDASLEVYRDLFRRQTKARLVATKYPAEAIKLANKYFFDFVLIDVTMEYNGTPFGGLELYKSLLYRYGDASLLAYSHFITNDLLKMYEYTFNFCERSSSTVRFVESSIERIRSLRRQQSCFVAMPFGKKYDPLFSVIASAIDTAGYRCVRVDRQQFTKSIIEKVLRELDSCKFVIFLATDQNPNAFYECGYAMALDKEIITLTDVYRNLPFDIRDRNAIAYGNSRSKLHSELLQRLTSLTVISP